MIRIATLQDIDDLMSITKACAAYMIAKNIYQWNEFYPSKKAFINDFKRNELYILILFRLLNKFYYALLITSIFRGITLISIKNSNTYSLFKNKFS